MKFCYITLLLIFTQNLVAQDSLEIIQINYTITKINDNIFDINWQIDIEENWNIFEDVVNDSVGSVIDFRFENLNCYEVLEFEDLSTTTNSEELEYFLEGSTFPINLYQTTAFFRHRISIRPNCIRKPLSGKIIYTPIIKEEEGVYLVYLFVETPFVIYSEL